MKRQKVIASLVLFSTIASACNGAPSTPATATPISIAQTKVEPTSSQTPIPPTTTSAEVQPTESLSTAPEATEVDLIVVDWNQGIAEVAGGAPVGPWFHDEMGNSLPGPRGDVRATRFNASRLIASGYVATPLARQVSSTGKTTHEVYVELAPDGVDSFYVDDDYVVFPTGVASVTKDGPFASLTFLRGEPLTSDMTYSNDPRRLTSWEIAVYQAGSKVSGVLPDSGLFELKEVERGPLDIKLTNPATGESLEYRAFVTLRGSVRNLIRYTIIVPFSTPASDVQLQRHFEQGGGFSYIPPVGWRLGDYPVSGPNDYKMAWGPSLDGFTCNLWFKDEIFDGSLERYVSSQLKTVEGIAFTQDTFATESNQRAIRLIFPVVQIGNVPKTHLVMFFFDGGARKFTATYSRLAGTQEECDEPVSASMKTFRTE